jgi:CRISPR system Cascade subunit CasE
MYLSRVEIPWRTIRNPYRAHKDIWLLFPGIGSESRKDLGDERQVFLFRIEENRLGRLVRVPVQSRQVPARSEKVAVFATREFNPQPREGQILSFLLTANPVKTITDKDGRQNKKGETKKCRVPLIKEEHQKEWLTSRLRDAADVQAVKVRPLP